MKEDADPFERVVEAPAADRGGRAAPFPKLTRFIAGLNAIALVVLLAGAFLLDGLQRELINARQDALLEQARTIARILAEPLAPDARGVDADLARDVLRALADDTEARLLFFDPDGVLVADSVLMQEEIIARPLPEPAPAGGVEGAFAKALAWVKSLNLGAFVPGDPRAEARRHSLSDDVTAALRGDARRSVRINEAGDLTVSVSAPVRKVRVVVGVLTLERTGVEEIIQAERRSLLAYFVIALGVTVASAVFIAFRIAAPIRKLARAADATRSGAADGDIPDFSKRRDEIGDLSISLRAMTAALYDRINAIESFAADVAHELKNPLTSLKSAVEVLARADTPEQRAKLIDIAAHDVRRIDRLITDISSASRIDAEMTRGAMETVDLARLLSDLVRHEYAQRSDGPSVRYAGPAAGLTILGAPDPLSRVFRNLIDNALSFSPADKEVTVLVGFAGMRGDAVEASVEDEGPGVANDAKEKIFQRFYTHRPGHGAFGGNSGLGLSICRQIVEAHRGRIWVEDRLHGGARFTVRLPTALPPADGHERFRSRHERD